MKKAKTTHEVYEYLERNGEQFDWKEPLASTTKDLDNVADSIINFMFWPLEVEETPLEEKITKPLFNQMMIKYNEVATKINKIAGFNRVIVMTASTRLERGPRYLQMAARPEQPKEETAKGKKSKPTINNEKPVQVPKDKVTLQAGQRAKSAPSDVPEHLKEMGTVAQILSLYQAGKTKKELIELGYNKHTVNRQVGEYIKRNAK